jgi:hypothetical protein
VTPARARLGAGLTAVLVIVVAGGALLFLRPWAATAPSATGAPAASPEGAASAAVDASASTGASASPAESPGDLLDQPIESAPPRGPDLTARENSRKGTDRWVLALDGTGDAEGYFDDVSVAPGQSIGLHVRSASPTVDVSIVRLGAYGGLGGRLVEQYRNVPVGPQPDPVTDPTTGMVTAGWSRALSVDVPKDWVSGLYLAVIAPPGGKAQYASFVVREPTGAAPAVSTGVTASSGVAAPAVPIAPILFVSPATSHEAYNDWGGKSLYSDSSTGGATVTGGAQAVTVSFDRPYREDRGAGRMLRWEYPFIRWMEASGYNVGYATDVDLQRDPSIAAGRRLIVFVGHPEYWSPAMRATLDGAIADGTNVAFFSANEMYWRVRLESITGPDREVTCYRKASLDPVAATDPSAVTTHWRDQPSPDPESRTIGQMYGHIALTPADWVVTAPDSWIYAGTGLQAGDHLPDLVGGEYDRFWPEYAPPGTTIVATSPVQADLRAEVAAGASLPPGEPIPPVANATLYTAPSGATVFSAGTMQWSWALDAWGSFRYKGIQTPVDERVKRITKNVLDRLGQ